MMIAPGGYNLRCVLLVAGPVSGLARAPVCIEQGPDRSSVRLTCWLTGNELRSARGWIPPHLGHVATPPRTIEVPEPRRLGERPGWTDPPDL